MEGSSIYFADDRWEKVEIELAEIKAMLKQLLSDKGAKAIREDQHILNAKQTAQLLGTDLPTIYARCANNMLPHFRVGKQYRFHRQEIIKWLESSKSKELNVDDFVNRYLQKKPLKG